MSKVIYGPVNTSRRAWWDELHHLESGGYDSKSIQVYEADADVQVTGLLDAHGQPLVRMVRKVPIGFKWSSEDES